MKKGKRELIIEVGREQILYFPYFKLLTLPKLLTWYIPSYPLISFQISFIALPLIIFYIVVNWYFY